MVPVSVKLLEPALRLFQAGSLLPEVLALQPVPHELLPCRNVLRYAAQSRLCCYECCYDCCYECCNEPRAPGEGGNLRTTDGATRGSRHIPLPGVRVL